MTNGFIVLYNERMKKLGGEIVYFNNDDENNGFVDVFAKNKLDSKTYIHRKYKYVKNDDTIKKVYYICHKDETHTIIFNDEPIEIPMYMNIVAFQMFIRCHYKDMCRINEDETIYRYEPSPSSKDLFVANNKYTNTIPT